MCERWIWACMRLHCPRCTRACDLRAPTMRPSPSRAHAWVRPLAYVANAHVMYEYICLYIYRRKGRSCTWVRVCVLAYACDRVRALTMREYAACVRVWRALFVRPSIDGTTTYTVCAHDARMYLYPCACGYPDERIADAGPPHARARVLRPCVRVRLGAHASAPALASAFRRRGPRVVRLAGVRVRVGVQREHRRVEHRACDYVVPSMRRLSGPGGAPPQAGRARPGVRCGAGRCARRDRRCARARGRRRVGMRMRGRPLVCR